MKTNNHAGFNMRIFYTFLISILLAACASTQLISSTDRTVIVKAELKKPDQAQAIADVECGKHHKKAKLNQYVPANIVWANYFFDCE